MFAYQPRYGTPERRTTLELKEGVEDASSAGFKSWNSRKCPTWLVPNCVSNPSSVRPSGVAMTPEQSAEIPVQHAAALPCGVAAISSNH